MGLPGVAGGDLTWSSRRGQHLAPPHSGRHRDPAAPVPLRYPTGPKAASHKNLVPERSQKHDSEQPKSKGKPKSLSTDKWKSKLCYFHTSAHDSAATGKEAQTPAATWRNRTDAEGHLLYGSVHMKCPEKTRL